MTASLPGPGSEGLRHCVVASPVGELVVVARDAAVEAVWVHEPPAGRPVGDLAPEDPLLTRAASQLGEYFDGTRTTFDLPLQPRGTTFQRQVWDEVARVPPGETRSYGQVAAAIGRPRAAQAVGSASARNPLSIVVPCHRLTSSSGTLTGYPEGHDRKRWLLAHERRGRGAR